MSLWAIVVGGSFVIGGLVHGAIYVFGIERTARFASTGNSWASSLQSIVFVPFVETLLLCIWVELLRLGSSSKLFIAVTAGVIAGLLHSIASPTWGFTAAWGFFVFASAYLAWRPSSLPIAFTAALVPHALNNATGLALIFFLD
ncbi:hypothetical protein [Caenimonas sp. SL110]|uniref:hypothetical protein n=1 Tax=Caenimonas sp. SL110 TaxID=1450524 RepID=UPI00128DFBEB|nr:hypothetical protein [Caenimonas sp. SL110]